MYFQVILLYFSKAQNKPIKMPFALYHDPKEMFLFSQVTQMCMIFYVVQSQTAIYFFNQLAQRLITSTIIQKQ